MVKKPKVKTPDWIVKTPDWILQDFDSEADYSKKIGKTEEKKTKTFKIKKCPKCGSYEVEVVLGEIGKWKCKKCGWTGKNVKGKNVKEEEVSEREFMKYLDEKGEEVA